MDVTVDTAENRFGNSTIENEDGDSTTIELDAAAKQSNLMEIRNKLGAEDPLWKEIEEALAHAKKANDEFHASGGVIRTITIEEGIRRFYASGMNDPEPPPPDGSYLSVGNVIQRK